MDWTPDVVKVRRNTTDDVALLSDEQILDFLKDNDMDTDLATADALEYMAAKQPYDSVAQGGVTVSRPNFMNRAAIYRARASLALEDGMRRNEIQMAKMTRTDLGPGTTVEYGIPDDYYD